MSENTTTLFAGVSLGKLYDKARDLNYLASEVDALIREVWTVKDAFYLTRDHQRITSKTFTLVYNMMLLKPMRPQDCSDERLWNSEKYAVRVALEQLGESASDVARTLQENGIDGLICASSQCPIANYLHQKIGALGVSVTSRSITVRGMWFETPRAVTEFIDAFDDGHYQNLIAGIESRDYLGFPGA